MKINAYAALTKNASLQPFIYEKELQSNEILVDIKYCSCTRGDVRFIENYWGEISYPLVPGLEIIGTVSQIGKNIKNFYIGDVVGIGYQVKSCFKCAYCLAGKEQFCLEQKLIPINEYGGFADKIIVDHRFVFHLPKNLQTANAAPLLCSGLTVYTAVSKHQINSGMNVGVIGIGSLGNLAVQFLDKLGCKVTAFSHSDQKKEIIKSLGADRVISSTHIQSLQKLNRSFDFIISTSAGGLDWPNYIGMLKPEGTLCFIGLPPEKISFKAELLADYAQRSITGNYIGSRQDMQNMLNFASKHNIQAITEVFPITKVNDVITKMRNNQIPFSAILDNNLAKA